MKWGTNMQKLEVRQMNVDLLIPYGGNAKIHDAEQVEKIQNSIACFGFNDPIAIDENNIIIEGHGRLIAAKELGMETVPVIVLFGLNEEQKNAYRLVHNKLTMNSDFDMDLLAEEIKHIDGIDMEEFGFAMEEPATWFGEDDYSQKNANRIIVECNEEDAITLREWLSNNDYVFKERLC